VTAEMKLPEGWCSTSLQDIADWGSGGTPARKNPEYYNGNIPWIKTGDLGPRRLSENTNEKISSPNSFLSNFHGTTGNFPITT
jgi:hypothetical protein